MNRKSKIESNKVSQQIDIIRIILNVAYILILSQHIESLCLEFLP